MVALASVSIFGRGVLLTSSDDYSDIEYLDLMDRFKSEGLPFSVAVLDMGWCVGTVAIFNHSQLSGISRRSRPSTAQAGPAGRK